MADPHPVPVGTDHPVPVGTGPVPARSEREQARRWTYEVWVVLGVTVLGSATYAALVLLDRYTIDIPLGEQSASLNSSVSTRPWLDLLYQLRRIAFIALPALMAIYLLAPTIAGGFRRIGLDFSRFRTDFLHGLGLAACIGIPGIALYAASRALGLTVNVQAATLASVWWTVPVLILAAAANGFLEESVVVGYLATRLRDLRWTVPAIIAASALLRGSYHLYQGPGMALGNVAMGVLFAWYFLVPRWGRRTMPLVIAHTLIDVVAFLGYALLPAAWLAALGVS